MAWRSVLYDNSQYLVSFGIGFPFFSTLLFFLFCPVSSETKRARTAPVPSNVLSVNYTDEQGQVSAHFFVTDMVEKSKCFFVFFCIS